MKLLYLIPGPISKGPLGPQEVLRRQQVLEKYAAPGVGVFVRDTEEGPSSIESSYEEYLSIPNSLREVKRAEREGFDGVIIGCYGDPGLDAAREIVKIPVLGPAESSMHLAAMLGHSFSILTVLDNVVPLLKRIARVSGLDSRLASVRTIATPVLSLGNSRKATLERLIEAGQRTIQQDGADTLILGCMSMAFLELNEDLESRLGVPVVNPALAALKMLESLVSIRLSHSKKAFPMPPKGELVSMR